MDGLEPFFPRQQKAKAPSVSFAGGKVPPHSLESEKSVLGGILLDNTALDRIADIRLEADDFYSESHQRVYRAVFDLITRGVPADIVTITNNLRDAGLLDKVGGAAYISSLVDYEYSVANILAYATIVKDKSQQRKIISVTAEQAGKAFDGVEDHTAFIEETEKKIFEVTSTKNANSFDPLKEILLRNFKQIEEIASRPGGLTGTPSGFKELDKHTSGWHGSQLIIVAARPGMGKTSFMLNLGLNASMSEKKVPVAIFSMEMSKEELTMRLLAMESRVDSQRLKNGKLQEQDWKNLQRAAGKLAECPIFIDDTAALNLLELKSRCRRLQSLHGLGLVVVDYLQLMRGLGGKSSSFNREQEIAEISRGLKALAKELNVPVIAASQLNRGVESRQDKRPMLSDLRESGAIEQDADMVMFIHRDEQYNKEQSEQKGEAEIIIGKHRSGQVGTIKLAWIGQYTTFKDLAHNDYGSTPDRDNVSSIF